MKLGNLENVFVGVSEDNDNKLSNEYAINTLLNENANMKKRINEIEEEKSRNVMQQHGKPAHTPPTGEMNEALQIKQMNTQLQKRVEFLQKREKELLEQLLKNDKN